MMKTKTLKARFSRLLRYKNGDAVLTFRFPKGETFEAIQLAARMKVAAMQGKPFVSIQVEDYHESRSLNANAYFWKLCTELAAKLSVGKDEIYRQMIYGLQIFDAVWVQESAADAFVRRWEHNGTGWIAEKMDTYDEEKILVHAYYGSSTYNQTEMARLIDSIVAECKLAGIETRSPDEITRMKVMWGAA